MRENFKYLSIFEFILIAFVFYGCNNNKESELPDPNWFNIDYSGENHISQKIYQAALFALQSFYGRTLFLQ